MEQKANFIDLARKTNIGISDWVINEIIKREKKIKDKKTVKGSYYWHGL